MGKEKKTRASSVGTDRRNVDAPLYTDQTGYPTLFSTTLSLLLNTLAALTKRGRCHRFSYSDSSHLGEIRTQGPTDTPRLWGPIECYLCGTLLLHFEIHNSVTSNPKLNNDTTSDGIRLVMFLETY